MKSTKGFTLIELLVVIAIIGILSAIALAALGVARNKGKAASAIGSMTSMRAQAELGISSGLYIANLCTTANSTTVGGLKELSDAAATQAGTAVVCNESADRKSWAASVDFDGLGAPSASRYFCVDNGGFSGPRATPLGAGTACPQS